MSPPATTSAPAGMPAPAPPHDDAAAPSSSELLSSLSTLSTLLALLTSPPPSLHPIPSLPHVIPSLLSPLVPTRSTSTALPDQLALSMGLPPLSHAAQMDSVKRYREAVDCTARTAQHLVDALAPAGWAHAAAATAERCIRQQGREGERARVLAVRKRRRVEAASAGQSVPAPVTNPPTAHPPTTPAPPLPPLPSAAPLTPSTISTFFTTLLPLLPRLPTPPARLRLLPPASASASHSTIHLHLPALLDAFLRFAVAPHGTLVPVHLAVYAPHELDPAAARPGAPSRFPRFRRMGADVLRAAEEGEAQGFERVADVLVRLVREGAAFV